MTGVIAPKLDAIVFQDLVIVDKLDLVDASIQILHATPTEIDNNIFGENGVDTDSKEKSATKFAQALKKKLITIFYHYFLNGINGDKNGVFH